MNLQRFSKIKTSLQTLGIVFLIFFAMAFACKDDTSSETNSARPTDQRQTNNTGGSCSTKAEFLGIFQRDRLKAVTIPDDIKPPELIVKSFDVGSPVDHKDVYNNALVRIYPAYPVKISWTTRTFRFGSIEEVDIQGGLFYCYKNPEDNKKFVSEDPRFPENACVCIAQNLAATGSDSKSRACPYDENDPDKTCPPTR